MSAMLFDNGVADGQPQAGSGWFGREKWVEDALYNIAGDTTTKVMHGYFHLLASLQVGVRITYFRRFQRDVYCPCSGHRFPCIYH